MYGTRKGAPSHSWPSLGTRPNALGISTFRQASTLLRGFELNGHTKGVLPSQSTNRQVCSLVKSYSLSWVLSGPGEIIPRMLHAVPRFQG